MTTTDFAQTMARLSDEELYEIAYPAREDDVAPAAMAAARAEIDKRGLSAEEEAVAKDRVARKRAPIEWYPRPPDWIDRLCNAVGAILIMAVATDHLAGWHILGGYGAIVLAVTGLAWVLYMRFRPMPVPHRPAND